MNEVILHVADPDAFFRSAGQMAARLDAGGRSSAPARLACETMDVVLKVLTANRWALLRQLRSLGPSSIRALAGALSRDYRGVHADVAALRQIGLIAKREDGRVEVPWYRLSAELVLEATP